MRNRKVLVMMIALFLLGVLVACTDKTTTISTTPTTSQAPVTTLPPTTTAPTTTVTTEAPLPTTMNLLTDLIPGNEGVYLVKTVEGVAQISYNKHGFEWPSIDVEITEDVSRFNKLVISSKGEGVLVVQLVGDATTYEVRFALTTGEVSRQINLRDYNDFLETVSMIRIYAEPGSIDARGSFELSKLEFDVGTAFGNVLEIKTPGYDTNMGWTELDEDTYDFTYNVDKSVTVNYTKGVDQGWIVMKTDFDLDLAAAYNTLTITLSGAVGKEVLLKPNDLTTLEKKITFTDTNPVTVVLTGSFTKMIMFAEPGVDEVTGSFTIHSQKLSYVPSSIGSFDDIEIDAEWFANTPALEIYDFSTLAEVTTITWNRLDTQAWEFIKLDVPAYSIERNVLKLVVKGEVGKQIIIKPNDKGIYEKTITFDGTDQVVEIKLNEQLDFVLIFVDPLSGSLTGSFDVSLEKAGYDFPGNLVTTDWVENDADTYDFTEQADGSILVEYNKGVDQGWIFMRNTFDVNAAKDKNLMLVIVKGTVGKSILLKPNDQGALERRVDFLNDDPYYIWVYADSLTDLIIFAEPGNEAVSGSFTIVGIYLAYEQPEVVERDVVIDFETGWVDNGDEVYTISAADGKTTVNYVKGESDSWSTMKYTFKQNIADHNLVTLVVKGTVNKQIMVKLNNQYEKWVTFTGDEQTVEIPLTYALTDILIFAEGGTASVSGSFEIISATVTWVPVPADITSGWVVNDAGTYTLVSNVDGSITVTYATTSYQFMINTFDAEEVLGLNTLTVVVQGTAGKTLLIKPNDSNALEQVITFDGTEQTFTFTAAGFVKLLLFTEPGSASLVEGTFTLVSVTLTYVAPVVE